MVMHTKMGPKYINRINKIKVLKTIYKEEEISRAEIAQKTKISAPTVTRIVNHLIDEVNLIKKIGKGASSGGRKPILLKFNNDDNHIIGIDIGTTHIDGILTNLKSEVIKNIRIPTNNNLEVESIVEKTKMIIEELESIEIAKNNKIYGIGIAAAGLINKDNGVIEYSPDFHWKNVDLVEILQQFTDLPIILDNVSRVMALGELWYGIGNRYKNFAVVNVGYGIGAGIILNGKLFYGSKGYAGEFGHITIDKDSLLVCECGDKGCLEALASGRAIAKRARMGIKSNINSKLVEMVEDKDYSKISAKMVADAARDGDLYSLNIIHKVGEDLGLGIKNLINLFNPEAIVIGGGVSQAGKLLFNKIKETLQRTGLKMATDIPILPATYGDEGTVRGTTAMVLNEILNLRESVYINEN